MGRRDREKGEKGMKQKLFAAVLAFGMAASFCAGPVRALEPKPAVSEPYAASEYYGYLTAVDLSGNWRQDLVAVALSQVGYHEGWSKEDYGGGSATAWGNFIEYGSIYGGLDAEWCAMFVSWCARQAQLPYYAVGNAARAASDGAGGTGSYWFHVYKAWPDYYTPKAGDLVFFTSDGYYSNHVGIAVKVTDTELWTVEGNALNAVRLRRYALDSEAILHYGVYLWDEGIETALPAATKLEFVNTDGDYALLPDSDSQRYSFETLWAVQGRVCALPTNPYEREGFSFAGFRVQRAEDGRWLCTDGIWRGAEERSAANTALYLLPTNAAPRAEGWLTEGSVLRLYAVWKDGSGALTEDSAAARALACDAEGWHNPFADLREADWYYETVRTAVRGGLLAGGETLTPNGDMTRGEFLTLLWRLSGAPESDAALPFTDVAESDDCFAAVRWAYGIGLTGGVSEASFAPDAPLSREQAATLLHRLLGNTETETDGDAETPAGDELPAEAIDREAPDEAPEDNAAEAEPVSFTDADTVSDWAREAVAWAAEASLLRGVPTADGGTEARPQTHLTRAQGIALVCRAAEF